MIFLASIFGGSPSTSSAFGSAPVFGGPPALGKTSSIFGQKSPPPLVVVPTEDKPEEAEVEAAPQGQPIEVVASTSSASEKQKAPKISRTPIVWSPPSSQGQSAPTSTQAQAAAPAQRARGRGTARRSRVGRGGPAARGTRGGSSAS